MKGLTLRISKWSDGDVGLEVLMALAAGVCVAAVFQWLVG